MNISDRSRTPSDPAVHWCPVSAVERANSEGMPRMGRRGSERSVMTVESVPEERESWSTASGRGVDLDYLATVERVGPREAAHVFFAPNVVYIKGTQREDISPRATPEPNVDDIVDFRLNEPHSLESFSFPAKAQRVSEIAAHEDASVEDVMPDTVRRKIPTRSRKSSLATVVTNLSSLPDSTPPATPLQRVSVDSAPAPAPAQQNNVPAVTIQNTMPLRRDVSPRDRSAYRQSIYQRLFAKQHEEVNAMPLRSAMKQPNASSRRRASTVRTTYNTKPCACCVIQ